MMFQMPKTINTETEVKDMEPGSHIGKMRVHKSGKVSLKIGEVVYDLDSGVIKNFAQEAALITEGELTFLGPVNH
jgi:hypothetical protein